MQPIETESTHNNKMFALANYSRRRRRRASPRSGAPKTQKAANARRNRNQRKRHDKDGKLQERSVFKSLANNCGRRRHTRSGKKKSEIAAMTAIAEPTDCILDGAIVLR